MDPESTAKRGPLEPLSASRTSHNVRHFLLIHICPRDCHSVEAQDTAQLPNDDDRLFGKPSVPTLTVASLPQIEVHQMWLLMNAGLRVTWYQARRGFVQDGSH